MFHHQTGDVAANKITDEPRLVWLNGDAFAKVGAMANASTCERRKIAVQSTYSAQNLFQHLTPVLVLKVLSDVVEIFSQNGAAIGFHALERRRDRFQQPRTLLNRGASMSLR